MDQLETGQVAAEGATLSEALSKAAQSLGVERELIEHKIDMNHFRNAAGRSVGVSTVRIIAWAQDPSRFEPARAGKDWLQGLIERMGLKGAVTFSMRGNERSPFARTHPALGATAASSSTRLRPASICWRCATSPTGAARSISTGCASGNSGSQPARSRSSPHRGRRLRSLGLRMSG